MGRKKIIVIKNCPVCTKEFEGSAKQKYCSKECTYEGNKEIWKERARLRAARKREEERKKLMPEALSLAEVNRLARAAGMSYGKYLVEQQLGRIK